MREDITATIPDHWLIDTGPTVDWYLKEGIWVHKDHDALLRVIAVYLQLKEIPEAFSELQECHEEFMVKFAPKIIKWGDSQKLLVQRSGTLKAMRPDTAPIGEEDERLLAAIFMPWVNKWAIGSQRMFQWVIAASTLEGICQAIGLSRQQLRRPNGKPTKKLLGFVTQFDPSLAWAWKLLLSGEYRRAEQTAKQLARRTVQQKGFYRREEQVLLTRARYWILVRVLRWTETRILTEQSSEREISSLSDDLKLFDEALGYERSPGAPPNKLRIRTGMYEKKSI